MNEKCRPLPSVRRQPAWQLAPEGLESRTHLSLAPMAMPMVMGSRNGAAAFSDPPEAPAFGPFDGPGPGGGISAAGFGGHPGSVATAPPPRFSGPGHLVVGLPPMPGRPVPTATPKSIAAPVVARDAAPAPVSSPLAVQQPGPSAARDRTPAPTATSATPSPSATPVAVGLLPTAPDRAPATASPAQGMADHAALAMAAPSREITTGTSLPARPGRSTGVTFPSNGPGASRSVMPAQGSVSSGSRAVRISLGMVDSSRDGTAPARDDADLDAALDAIPLPLGVDLMLEPGASDGLGRLDAALDRFLHGLDDLAEPIETASPDATLLVGAVVTVASAGVYQRWRRRRSTGPSLRPWSPGSSTAFPYA